MSKKRCEWVSDNPLYVEYHDEEWGEPVYDDQTLFEFLVLEGAQAGLSWITVLKKRERYREVFHDFDIETVARFGKRDINRLMKDEGIIRNRLKIESAIKNAKATISIIESQGSLADFLWDFVGGEPVINHWKTLKQVPASTAESEAMSKALKKQGFNFVGPTICYAFMQAVGMVNDHTAKCFKSQ